MKAFDNKESGLLTSLDFKKTKTKVGYWIMFSFVLIMAIISAFPAVWVLLSSFKDIKEFLSSPPTLLPHSFHPEKLLEVWNKMKFGRYYLNTFYMAFGDLAFALIVNGLAGYVISRLKPKGSQLFFVLVLWSMMLPHTVSMVPLFMTFLDFPVIHTNLMNTYLPMWLLKGANAFNVLLFKSFFDSIPMSYVEAARIDGCSDAGIFRRIILPLSKPVLMVVSIFSFNGTWAEFFWPYLVLKEKSLYTVPVQIFKMKSVGFPMDQYVIVLFFAIIPSAVVFLFCQKYIMQGIAIGGIKG